MWCVHPNLKLTTDDKDNKDLMRFGSYEHIETDRTQNQTS